jgi:hypothetical protein
MSTTKKFEIFVLCLCSYVKPVFKSRVRAYGSILVTINESVPFCELCEVNESSKRRERYQGMRRSNPKNVRVNLSR